tara:strand:+ start:2300 stop:3199 length:900 start_codon:yes stop_codon:yes gene_type:complete
VVGKLDTSIESSPWRGIGFFVAAWFVVPNMDVAAKLLGQWGYPVLMVVWARFAFSLLILLLVIPFEGKSIFLFPREPGKHVMRALLLVLATVGFFHGLKTMPLADALATYFVYPFLITALAPIFLAERPGWRRWTAVGFGFVGSLIVIRPGLNGLSEGTVYVLFAALAFSGYNLMTRSLRDKDDPWRTVTFQSLIGLVATTPFLFWYWHAPAIDGFFLFIVIGFAATLGHYFLVRAFALAPAPVLAPFAYVEIVAATVLGYIVFGEFPDIWTWTGVAVIAASGIVIAVREGKVGPKSSS